MDTHRTPDLPTFPPGSGASEADRHRAGLLALWSSVVAFGLISGALLLGDEAIYNGTNIDDVGPMDGLASAAVVVAGLLFGAIPLVNAVVHSIAAVRRKPSATARPALLISLYTAASGIATAGFWVNSAEQTAEQRRVLPDALRHGELLMGSTAVLGLLPLVVCLAGGVSLSELRPRVGR